MISHITKFYRTFKKILEPVFWLGGGVLVIAGVAALFSKPTPDLKISSIVVDCYRPDGSCSLDVKLFNNGDGVAVIDKVIVRPAKIKYDPILKIEPSLPTSGEYVIDVSKIEKVGHSGCFISEQVQPGQGGRFSIILTGKEIGAEFRSYQLHVAFEINSGKIISGGIVPKDTTVKDSLIMLPYNKHINATPPWLAAPLP